MTCLVEQSGDINPLFIWPVCSASSHSIHFHFSHLCSAAQESAIDFLPSCGRPCSSSPPKAGDAPLGTSVYPSVHPSMRSVKSTFISGGKKRKPACLSLDFIQRLGSSSARGPTSPEAAIAANVPRPVCVRACTTALNSFRDTKEAAIETTTQFIGPPPLDSIDLCAAVAGIPMT